MKVPEGMTPRPGYDSIQIRYNYAIMALVNSKKNRATYREFQYGRSVISGGTLKDAWLMFKAECPKHIEPIHMISAREEGVSFSWWSKENQEQKEFPKLTGEEIAELHKFKPPETLTKDQTPFFTKYY